MNNLKTFESWKDRNPAEEGTDAIKYEDYLKSHKVDEVTLNLNAFDEIGLSELINLLRNQSELIEDEINKEAINIIEKYISSEK